MKKRKAVSYAPIVVTLLIGVLLSCVINYCKSLNIIYKDFI